VLTSVYTYWLQLLQEQTDLINALDSGGDPSQPGEHCCAEYNSQDNNSRLEFLARTAPHLRYANAADRRCYNLALPQLASAIEQ